MIDQLGDGRVAVRQAAQDAQPVHVGHDLVEGAQLAEIVGLYKREVAAVGALALVTPGVVPSSFFVLPS